MYKLPKTDIFICDEGVAKLFGHICYKCQQSLEHTLYKIHP